jgi:hypothetical protein
MDGRRLYECAQLKTSLRHITTALHLLRHAISRMRHRPSTLKPTCPSHLFITDGETRTGISSLNLEVIVFTNSIHIIPYYASFILINRGFILPVTVAERSKAWTVFARSEAEIVGSNSTQFMDVWCMCLFCIYVVLCLGRVLATSWSLVQGVLTSVKMIVKLKKRPGPMGAV